MGSETDERGAGDDVYRAAFERSPDPMLVQRAETGAVVTVNEAAEELLGRSEEQLTGETLSELGPGSDSEEDQEELLRERARETGSVRTEWEIDQPDGTRWVDVRVERAGADRLVVYLRDLTERRKLEVDLQRERGLTERVLDTTPTGIVVHDAGGTVTIANPRAEEILGLTPSELDGQPYDDPSFDLRTIDGDRLADEEYPFTQVKATGESIAGKQVRLSTAEGERIVSVSGAPLWDDGEFDGAVLSIQDVTGEFETRARIRGQREQLETVIDHLPVVLFAFDPEGTFTLSRGSGLSGLGLQPDELDGTSVFDAYADNPSVLDAVERALTGEPLRVTQEAGGRVYDTQYRPITDEDGNLEQVIGVSLDVTERNEQERRLQTLLEALPTGVFMADTEGTIEFMNDTATAIVGTDGEDVAGEQMSDVLSEAQFDTFGSHYRAAVERRELTEGEHTVETPDGTQTVRVVVAPVTSTQGDADTIVGVVSDVTERKRRERQLEENDAILSQLTRTEEVAFWLFDSDFSELQFVNDAYADIWGKSVESLRADPMSFIEAIHPDDRERVVEGVQRLRERETVELEFRVNPREDFERWVWVRGDPIVDGTGDVKRIAGVTKDITARKHREQELERSERQFEAVFNDPNLLVAMLDLDGSIQRINDTSLSYVEADRETVEGTPFPESPWWNHDPELQADLREWLESAAAGQYVEFEADHPLPTGGTMTVDGTIRPVTDENGTVTSLIVSARDITARVEHQQKLEESNERLERFAYVASHDLQEPLRTISNYVELIEDEYGEELDEEAERLIDVVVTGSERMQSMINGLLDYSRVTTRGSEFETVDTDAVVESVVDDLGIMLEEQEGSVDHGELPTVRADGDQLRQLVQNLVKNALEHADGPVDIEIRGQETVDGYRFEVADDGPGIEENRQEKIFRIFKSSEQYQTSSQAKGIGLAICENIVQRHGGDIWVESDPGDGATFVFTIENQ